MPGTSTRYQADPQESRRTTQALIRVLFSEDPMRSQLARQSIDHIITTDTGSFTDIDLRCLTFAAMIDDNLNRPIITGRPVPAMRAEEI